VKMFAPPYSLAFSSFVFVSSFAWGDSPLYWSQSITSSSHLSLENNSETLQLSLSQYRGKMEWDVSESIGFNLEGRFRHYEGDGFGREYLDESAYSDISRPLYLSKNDTFTLRDFNIEIAHNKWFLTLGKQQVVWGKSDGLKLLDVVNPQSFEQFVLEDFDESRIPLWMANIEYSFENHSTLQILWIPDTSSHILPLQGSPYRMTSYRVAPALPTGVPVHINTSEPIKNEIQNSEFGIKWATFFKGWDLSLNYLDHYDDFAAVFIDVDSSGIQLNPEYQRTQLIGSSASTSISDFTLRTEFSYTVDQHFQRNNPHLNRGVIFADEISVVLGLDWYGLSDTVLSWQVFNKEIKNAPSDIALPASDTTFTFLARRNFMNETLSTEVLLIHNKEDSDGMLRPKLDYRLNDDLTVTLSLDIFYGNTQGLYGQFDRNDRAGLEFEFSF
jgi:hypothetical protein